MRRFEIGIVVSGHGLAPFCGRAHRGLPCDATAAGAIGPHPERQRRAAAAAEDGGKPAIRDVFDEISVDVF